MLEVRVIELENKVEKLEQEVEYLKNQLKNTTSTPIIEKKKEIENRPAVNHSEHKVKKTEPVDWEKLIAQVWLPRIFIFVFMLGAIFGFVAAVDAGLITEPVRIVLGLIASAILIWLGEKQITKHRAALGLVLLGGSITLLMITTFAAQAIYGYIPPMVALIFNVIWIGLGIFLANRHNSESLGIFAGVGGYLIPFLLSGQKGSIFLFASYELILYLSLLYFSMKKSYIKLFYLSSVLLHAVYLLYMFFTPDTNIKYLAIPILIQHVFLLLTFLRKELYLINQISIMFGSAALTLAWSASAFTSLQFDILLLVFTTVYALVSYAMKNTTPERLSIPISISSFSLMIYLLRVLNADTELILLLFEGTFVICLAFKIKSTIQKISGSIIYVFGVSLAFFSEIDKLLSIVTISWIVLIISLNVLFKFIKENSESETFKIKNNILVVLGAMIVFTSLVFVSQISYELTEGFAYNIQEMVLSFTWALFSVAAVIYGLIRENRKVRIFGIVLIFVTLLKLIFVDLPTLSIAIRAILFIGLGVIGVVMSRMFYKKK